MTAESNAHRNMIWQQLRPNDVSDPAVLQTLEKINRADFVAPELAELAYADTALAIGCDQYLLSPLQEARMLQALQLSNQDVVLEVGTGSGYFTALLASLASKVYSVEFYQALSDSALRRLQLLRLNNIDFSVGDAVNGWPLPDRVDAVILTAAVPVVSSAFLEQIHVGGRLIAIVGEAPAMQLQRVTRISEREWQTNVLFETVAPYLLGAEKRPEFAF
ncbi:Protein-L-isoaspartate(D-aspartate) O-methyltransferase() [Methylophaga frappieri]|jgi:protein-L-isoaspartate(D-aspartate) O-methyltransferase|uniref:Protein-L-isoaspartate O-methyltransferase n=1 Tax=Methylophaga frappieri (strain ATCC BAA-2434 / DSM 25690 / JAM7) TaxID=754477 RepID=I1YI06_METFJ|nr:protein-L-isoaspartate O-methyltransferase [Methylophaga frappieri]AFJ02549.1 Protein-L-isoaspartate(D-aspartate) O-methyltransferase() [Methylophaga frappieri]